MLSLALAAFAVCPQEIPAVSSSSFAGKADAFWSWFEEEREALHGQVSAGEDLERLAERVESRLAAVLDIGWTFGEGTEEGVHLFALSPEGDDHRRLLAQAMLRRAPELAEWEFHSSKPPTGAGLVLEVGDHVFKPGDAHVVLELDEGAERFHVVLHHPAFEGMAEEERSMPMFLLLDEALGEDGVEMWIGRVAADHAGAPEGAIPLSELYGVVQSHAVANGWLEELGLDAWTSYDIPSRDDLDEEDRRRDVIRGGTCNFDFLRRFHSRRLLPSDPLKRKGAEYAYVRYSNDAVDQLEEPGRARREIEDAMRDGIDAAHVTGWAMRERYTYVDFLILDRPRTVAQLETALSAFEHVENAELLTFVRRGPKPVSLQAPGDR